MSSNKSNTYHQILNQALKRYHDAKWLGDDCPLASLYFAGEWIETDHALLTPEMRGKGLQKMLRTALDSMWVGEKVTSPTELHKIAQESFDQNGRDSLPYQYLLLELRYFRHTFPSRSYPQTNQEFLDFLGVSRAHFFNHLKYAVSTFGDFLLRLSQPTFRLERPRHQTDFIGRTTLVDQLHMGLQQGESGAISGVGGIGKTALGRLVSQKWESDDLFWYTIRPRITDHVESLIYALGAFLHKKSGNRSVLWKQLMSGSFQDGQTELYLGLLRQDIEPLNAPLLLCFDEVDLLQTDVTSERGVEHRALLFLLENLCDTVPVLLMGQHIPLDTRHHIALRPLNLEQTKTLVAAKSDLPDLSDENIETIHIASRGIPRLIELALALYQTGESLASVVDTLSDSASAHAVMGRLWNRLNTDEQDALTILAVSQGGIAPRLLPETTQQTLSILMQRTLINNESNGGIILDELIRRLVHRWSNRQQRDQAHLIVADIRYTLGEYTMSAYHFAQAEAYDQAIESWYPHKDREIERGHAQRAKEIFLNIPSRQLNKKRKKELQIICNQLHFLTGDSRRIIKETTNLVDTIDKADSDQFDPVNVEIRNQLGMAHMLIDNLPAAQTQYEQNLKMLTELFMAMCKTMYEMSPVYKRSGELETMRQFLKRGDLYVNYTHGLIEGTTSFSIGTRYLEQALAIAESLDDQIMINNIKWSLARFTGYSGNYQKAIMYYEYLADQFADTGDMIMFSRVQGMLGSMYLVSKNYKKSIETLKPIIELSQNINDSYTLSKALQNISEAYLHLGDLESARSSALQNLQLEFSDMLPEIYYVLGLVEGKRGNSDSALEILNEAVTLVQKIQNKYIEAYIERGIGTVHLDANQPYLAHQKFDQAIKLFSEMGLINEVNETELLMHSVS